MYKAILWDNDGILVQTEHLYYEANRRVLADQAVDLTLEQYRNLLLSQNVGVWHLVQNASEAEITDLKAYRNEIYSELLRTEDIQVDGAQHALESLHGRLTMGIVTSSRKDHFQIIHGRSGLLEYFDFVVAAGDFERSKPNPDPYLVGLDRCGFNADECLAIEDSERGLIAAKRAGLTCWVIPGEMTSTGDFSTADRVLDSIQEVPSLLLT